MLVNKNEIILFQKSPWNVLSKKGILLKIPFFQNQILRECFNQSPQQHHFCTVNSLSMMQKSLGYAINKFGRFYRVQEKNHHFQENQKLQNWSHELKQQLFYQKLFLIQSFDYCSTNGKINWISAYSLVKYIICLLDMD